MDADTFRESLEAHRANYQNPWSFDAQTALQQLHLQRAEALEAVADPEALAHLRAAEDCQWVLGSESTSAGDGYESMGRLYKIRARRAELCEKLGDIQDALDLWESIAADPNGLGKFAAPAVARLRAQR